MLDTVMDGGEGLLRDAIARQGYALLPAAAMRPLLGPPDALADWPRFAASWDDLPLDTHLPEGHRYRRRRHATLEARAGATTFTQAPHQPHYQSLDYNPLVGGIERWFEPIEQPVTAAPVWGQLIASLGVLFARVRAAERWYIEAHQFRIDTANGIGRPTPEGAHRDGVDFVAVILVGRRNLRGGETRVFDAHGSSGVRFTMEEPWSALLMDDERVIHETTPIQPEGGVGARDTLVLTYRANGFQAP
jgi:hypothetical protein